ncbi:FkbM family methyltransferase [Bizionia sp. M204]|uniref:FkbM family methyltransferase n=1 Tax=Bizionia sp. M204 TaxID=2675331 RepID=UPI00205789B6|nr:FkbM family methyltransferase [Bizionia sp. M204]UPS91676.1 FkbM family methyltransferase [Bizionia sp. M204]
MIQLLRIFKTYGYEGFKQFVKLQLGRIPYLKFKDDTRITIYIPKYKQPIYLRRHTSDFATFKQIFDAKEYALDYPFKPKTIIDAGANVGLAAVYFIHRFPKTKIYSIEPEASNIRVLKKNTKAYKQVVLLPNALHHTTNELLEIVDEGIGKWGFVTKQATEILNAKSIVSSVQTVSIQAIIDRYEISIIDILKIDIEGAEMALFEKNYDSWLPKTRCLIIELHDRFYPGCQERVFGVMDQYNFSQFKKGENWVFFNEDFKL